MSAGPILHFVLIAVLSLAVAAHAAEPENEENPSVLEEKVTVTATRLPDGTGDRAKVPASVSVIDRESIERSGARTLQDLMAAQTGVILYDQTGNFVQTTFDLRGFTTGSGTKVYLDGVPFNDPDNNALALQLVPLGMLERVEITRGSAASLAGGGSEAGVIRLQTRRVEEFGGALSIAAGSDSALRVGGEVRHRAGKWDFNLHGTSGEDDGFRQNAGGRLTRLGGSAGFDLGENRRLELSVIAAEADFGNPGALTPSELEQDRETAPFNLLDYSDQRYTQAALNYRGGVGGPFHLAANVYYAGRKGESLSTGRIAPRFGGFQAESESATAGTTVQLSHLWRGDAAASDLAIGVEWLESDTDALGYRTPPEDPGTVSPEGLLSDNNTGRSTRAIYAQESWSPVAAWGLTAGLRYDSDRVSYAERFPDPGLQDSLTFEEFSARAGVTWAVRGPYVLRASYGEAFLPPTVEQLFAFPGFGSNPDLAPEDTGTWELGLYADWSGRATLDVALFQVDTENEIIFDPDFDPDSELGPFGANVNAGETRRTGIEASLRGALSSRVDGFVSATFIDATFGNGPDEGNTVPLVPGERFAAGLAWTIGAGFALRADAVYVGEQVLDNDDSNGEPRLAAYTVVNARLSWDLGRRAPGRTTALDGLLFFAEVTNLLDEQYATRGIFAFDFSSTAPGGEDSAFLTPAPGRRFMLGAQWRF